MEVVGLFVVKYGLFHEFYYTYPTMNLYKTEGIEMKKLLFLCSLFILPTIAMEKSSSDDDSLTCSETCSDSVPFMMMTI